MKFKNVMCVFLSSVFLAAGAEDKPAASFSGAHSAVTETKARFLLSAQGLTKDGRMMPGRLFLEIPKDEKTAFPVLPHDAATRAGFQKAWKETVAQFDRAAFSNSEGKVDAAVWQALDKALLAVVAEFRSRSGFDGRLIDYQILNAGGPAAGFSGPLRAAQKDGDLSPKVPDAPAAKP